MKHSEDLIKRSIPGHLEVLRYCDADGTPRGDVICDLRNLRNPSLPVAPGVAASLETGELKPLPQGVPVRLLAPLIEAGRRTGEREPIETAKKRANARKKFFAPALFGEAAEYPNLLEQGLANQRKRTN